MIEPRTTSAVVLPPAAPADLAAIERVAQLDSRPLPRGPHLVAERDGRIDAAISVRTRELVANPFVPTADLCDLLRLRAGELARPPRPTARRVLRPRPLRAAT